MFIDEAIITVKGGHGGAGKVSYFVKKGGPSGGNGGNGADVYAVLNNNIKDLKKFISIGSYPAESGMPGGINRQFGKNGSDLLIHMPGGTTIINRETNVEVELNADNPKILLAKGGRGGRGNDALKSPVYQTPKKSEPGVEGEKIEYKLILKLLADYGLIGLPNAGKSSLINMLTAANVKTAAYPFTTLEPNLGEFNRKIIADIPGLIEGASGGKGLGIKFLKHVEKVNLILHCVPCDSANIVHDYETVIKEIKQYDKRILEKKQVILLTKIDLVTEKEMKEKMKLLKKYKLPILPLTIYDESTLEPLKKILLEN
jgi:GTP-binding protein